MNDSFYILSNACVHYQDTHFLPQSFVPTPSIQTQGERKLFVKRYLKQEESKEEIQLKIKNLTKKLKEINQAYDRCLNKISKARIQINKNSQIVLKNGLRGLDLAISSSRKVLSRESIKSFESLQRRKRKYVKRLTVLQEKLSSFYRESPTIFFELEYCARKDLEQDQGENKGQIKFYTDVIFPLLKKIRESIPFRPYHLIARAAAAKGRAVHTGITAFKMLRESDELIEEPSDINQSKDVYLLPHQGAVFKKIYSRRVREEEELAHDILQLMATDIPVEAFSFESSDVSRFGFRVLKKNVCSIDYMNGKFEGIQVNPYIADMILMNDIQKLSQHPKETLERILSRLTPEAEVQAIATGEIQCMDLHDSNLGLVPASNDDNIEFRTAKFCVFNGNVRPFSRLLLQYQEGKIRPEALIRIIYEDRVVQNKLKNLPALREALDSTRWQFVIFDLDLCLSESNDLTRQLRTGKSDYEYMIPFRCALLGTAWKDRPLSKQTVQWLMNSEERDLRVRQWIKRMDAPIYRRISLAAINELEEHLNPMIFKYSLSNEREFNIVAGNGRTITLETLRKQFVQEICSQGTPVWNLLEKELSLVKTYLGDTWETIAKRHGEEIQKLKKLNDSEFEPGKKIKIHLDLTSPSKTANKKRIKIARQLFPRLSRLQQAALIERQTKRTKYLKDYEKFASLPIEDEAIEDEAILDLFEEYILQSETPLSKHQKKIILFAIKQLRKEINNPQESEDFQKTIRKLYKMTLVKCQPTYFNVMKAMYPLLADAYELNERIFENEADAGSMIGDYRFSLNWVFERAIKNQSTDTFSFSLAQELGRKMESIQNPSFFGEWN